jgi:hypothetical protein
LYNPLHWVGTRLKLQTGAAKQKSGKKAGKHGSKNHCRKEKSGGLSAILQHILLIHQATNIGTGYAIFRTVDVGGPIHEVPKERITISRTHIERRMVNYDK